MKNVIKLAVALSLGSALSSAAFAASTVEQAYIEHYKGRTDIPVPVAVVAPVAHSNSNAQVDLTFVVDAKGRPTKITVVSATDESLVDAVTDAIAQWRFQPAIRNGKPVATQVALPVRIVPETKLASLD